MYEGDARGTWLRWHDRVVTGCSTVWLRSGCYGEKSPHLFFAVGSIMIFWAFAGGRAGCGWGGLNFWTPTPLHRT